MWFCFHMKCVFSFHSNLSTHEHWRVIFCSTFFFSDSNQHNFFFFAKLNSFQMNFVCLVVWKLSEKWNEKLHFVKIWSTAEIICSRTVRGKKKWIFECRERAVIACVDNLVDKGRNNEHWKRNSAWKSRRNLLDVSILRTIKLYGFHGFPLSENYNY